MSDLPPSHDGQTRRPDLTVRSLSDRGLPDHAVRIVTGSRLHFGLIHTVEPFGGVGLMIDRPATDVLATRAAKFQYCGPQPQRAFEIAARIASHCASDELPGCRIDVLSAAPAHQGLGSGTQLSMAIAEAICCCQRAILDPISLATEIARRGKRSAVGVHGYFHGGLILEGSSTVHKLSPLCQRVPVPGHWCAALLCPVSSLESVHGELELERFSKLAPSDPAVSDELRRLAVDQLLPSVQANDFSSFSAAVQSFNRISGSLFAPIQGGSYRGPQVTRVVDWLLNQGVVGVGQSSWGPSVFAWFESRRHAEVVIQSLPDDIRLMDVVSPKNQGREVKESLG
jgi:beta-RFAP synthase